ncbi:MAG TPA: hypothetical protein VK255_03600 [Patescibacteria group bacterium]|nr:hypothetical protein [Patescibacteria group bacterium]
MKKHKASILAVTLIILSIILTTALAISLAAIKQKSASLGSSKSSLAFQNANKGVEDVLNDIMLKSAQKVNQLVNCTGGKIVSAGYAVTLKKDDTEISCLDGSINMSEITSIKSVGTGDNQEQRAIEAAVAFTQPFSKTYDVTSSRSFSSEGGSPGHVYQNNTGKPMFVTVKAAAANNDPLRLIGQWGAGNPPGAAAVVESFPQLTSGMTNQNSYISISFIVPANWYYFVTKTHSVTGTQWTETY